MSAFLSSHLFALIVLAWIAWKVLKKMAQRDPLSLIPGPPSESFWFGNMKGLLDPNGWDYHDRITKKYGSLFRVGGLLQKSTLYIFDTKAMYNILVKDTETFEETDDFLKRNTRLFGMGLLSTTGQQHRKQRKILNPVFSIAHMRHITPIVFEVVHELRESLAKQVARGEKEINLNKWMTRTALEAIGQAGFGYSFDSLEPDAAEHPFAASLKNLAPAVGNPLIRMALIFPFPYVYNLGSPRFQRAVIGLLPWKKLHELRDMVDVMHLNSIELLEATKRSLGEGQREANGARAGGGKDIMSVLVTANMSAQEEDKLTDEELVAQISVLTFAAMDTTSNALSRILHILSEKPEAQERLRQEVTQAYAKRGGKDPSYDELNALPFLDAVCKETLRLHAPVPYVFRQAKKDGVLPAATPVKTTDNCLVDEVFVPKDTRIILSLRQCNRNPEIWGLDAEEWKPERWLAPLPETVARARVPGAYANLMTFIGGNRACIGFKFSELEMKIVLSVLMKSFHFSPSGRKVVWRWSGIAQPTTEDTHITAASSRVLQLPLKVTAVRS